MFTFLKLGEAGPSTTLGTIIFVLLAFSILMYLIKIFAWKPLIAMMEKRENKIANDLDSAEIARTSAQKLEQERQAALQNSRSEAMNIVNTAKTSGEQSRQNILQEARADAEKIKEKTTADLTREKEQTMRDMQKDVANISLEIAGKILNQELSSANHTALIDDFIAQLGTDHETR
ncbi:F0F1 ATP synthase subunit B [Enterococcus timonensis]|uniref:F0F1 ATP synthase subunit B n=1 Tax=Enterococcus timonensis TaxID=1852364 RepID=UPI0008DAC88B|nr:F0F1 ATP synthase subunit B [Enterococcus timonensis]